MLMWLENPKHCEVIDAVYAKNEEDAWTQIWKHNVTGFKDFYMEMYEETHANPDPEYMPTIAELKAFVEDNGYMISKIKILN